MTQRARVDPSRTGVHQRGGGGLVAGLVILSAILIPIGISHDPDPPAHTSPSVPAAATKFHRGAGGRRGHPADAPRDGKTGRVRLVGINAPELAHDGKSAQCGAEPARNRLLGLLGQAVRMIHDPTQANTDEYDRTLDYVEHDGADIGGDQVTAGAAREYTLRQHRPQATGRVHRAQSVARDQRRGVWGVADSMTQRER